MPLEAKPYLLAAGWRELTRDGEHAGWTDVPATAGTRTVAPFSTVNAVAIQQDRDAAEAHARRA